MYTQMNPLLQVPTQSTRWSSWDAAYATVATALPGSQMGHLPSAREDEPSALRRRDEQLLRARLDMCRARLLRTRDWNLPPMLLVRVE